MLVEEAAKMAMDGKSVDEIINRLDEGGYVTKRNTTFRKNSLHDILTNMKYKGVYFFNRSSAKSFTGTRNSHAYKDSENYIAVPGGCPRIIDDATFEKVQQRVKSNTNTGGRQRAKYNYLLSGKVFCMNCGRSMSGNAVHSGRDKTLHITYRCPNHHRLCDNKEINRDHLERYVVSLLEKKVFNTDALHRLAERIESYGNTDSELFIERQKELSAELVSVETALANVADAIANGLISEALTNKLRDLEDKRTLLLSEIEKYASKSQDDLPCIDVDLIIERYTELKDAQHRRSTRSSFRVSSRR